MPAAYPAGVTSNRGDKLKINRGLNSIGIPGYETKQARIKCPTADFRLHINPNIRFITYYDASNSANARFETTGASDNLTRDLSDRDINNGSGSAMDAGTTSDRLYICFSMPVGGIHVEMKTRNGNSAVLTANYWNGAWTDTGAKDGTAKQGATLNQDGDITWSEKTDWLSAKLGGPPFDGAAQRMSITDQDAPGVEGYWLQLLWGSALASDVEIANLWAIHKSPVTKDSDHGYYEGAIWNTISFDKRNVGAIQAFLDDPDIEEAELVITWIRTTME